MAKIDEMIATAKSVDYPERKQFWQYFARLAEGNSNRLAQEDREALLEFAYEEADKLRQDILNTESYKVKDMIFTCEDCLLGMVMGLCPSPSQIPPEKLIKIRALTELVDGERRLEKTLDSIFGQSTITETDIKRVLYWARRSTDEYQKGKLFEGLVHYSKDISKLDSGAKQVMTDYIAAELDRLSDCGGEDAWNTLELMADISKHFGDERVRDALTRVLRLGRSHINVYAMDTLLSLGAEVPRPVIESLARDLEFADLTYSMLSQHGKTALFPAELATEEYLAKSDLVHWLTFPTELGQKPDEIEYIGKIRRLFKKEVFHVFKFRSDSQTLEEARQNKWLVGWSSNKGGTFSNFDELAPYERETVEKTLKQIRKKLIG